MATATIGLSPTRIINVGVNLAPTGAALPNLSTLLLLGTSTVIDVVQRMRNYTTLPQVAADFGTAAQEYLGAQAWFGQTPQPQSLAIGRWAQAAAAGQLIGGPVSATNQLIATWTAITTGTLSININGAGVQAITGLTFAAQTNLNGVASIIQTALRAVGTGGYTLATVTWNPGTQNFVISSGTTGTASTPSGTASCTCSSAVAKRALSRASASVSPRTDSSSEPAQANPRRWSTITRMPMPAEVADVSDSTWPS